MIDPIQRLQDIYKTLEENIMHGDVKIRLETEAYNLNEILCDMDLDFEEDDTEE